MQQERVRLWRRGRGCGKVGSRGCRCQGEQEGFRRKKWVGQRAPGPLAIAFPESNYLVFILYSGSSYIQSNTVIIKSV